MINFFAMWPFNKTSDNPNFGFQVEVVQQLENGNTVYAGYGFRVVEIKNDRSQSVYQLRAKNNILLDWGLLGTFGRASEVRKKLAELELESKKY